MALNISLKNVPVDTLLPLLTKLFLTLKSEFVRDEVVASFSHLVHIDPANIIPRLYHGALEAASVSAKNHAKNPNEQYVTQGIVAILRLSISKNANTVLETKSRVTGGKTTGGLQRGNVVTSPGASSHFSPAARTARSASPSARRASVSAATEVGAGVGGSKNIDPVYAYENSLIPVLNGIFSLVAHPSHHVRREVAMLVRAITIHRPYLLRPVLHFFLDYMAAHSKEIPLPDVYKRERLSNLSPVSSTFASFSFFTTFLLSLFVVDVNLVKITQVGQLKRVEDDSLSLRLYAYDSVEKLLERLTPPLLLQANVGGAAATVMTTLAGAPGQITPLKTATQGAKVANRKAAVTVNSSQYVTVSSAPLFEYGALFQSISLSGLVDVDDIVKKGSALLTILLRQHKGAVFNYLPLILSAFNYINQAPTPADSSEAEKDLNKKRAVAQIVAQLDEDPIFHYNTSFQSFYTKWYVQPQSAKDPTPLQKLIQTIRG